jgi:hypothetical protein
MTFKLPPMQPSRDKGTLRRQLQAERQTLIDRHQRAMHLQEVLRVWLIGRDGEDHRRLLADQGRVRLPAGSVPLDRRCARRRDAAHRPAGGAPRDRLAALSRLVPGLPDRARCLRHPQAEGHRGVRAPNCWWCPAWVSAPAACAWAMAAGSSTARSSRCEPRPVYGGGELQPMAFCRCCSGHRSGFRAGRHAHRGRRGSWPEAARLNGLCRVGRSEAEADAHADEQRVDLEVAACPSRPR